MEKKSKIRFTYVKENDNEIAAHSLKEIFNDMIVECGRRCFSLEKSEGSKMTDAEILCMNRCMSKQITIENKVRLFTKAPVADLPQIKPTEAQIKPSSKMS